MVTGGESRGYGYGSGYGFVSLSSTEILTKDASHWVYAGPLPSARDGLSGARLSDKLIMTGEMVEIQ